MDKKMKRAVRQFEGSILLMIVYSVLLAILGCLELFGMELPQEISAFSLSTTNLIFLVAGGIIGLIGGIIATGAVEQKNTAKMWICGICGVAQILLIQIVVNSLGIERTMHLNVVTTILWFTPVIFGGRAIYIAMRGWGE